ncbi:hypothetical protein GCM10023186_07370 [Hymenobacter koreensis]|uniref:TonB C-terminal domain-containing protein n=1 Tax=Hymenobacter koreensis TaxID=1084523 RepID=A0ABP8IVW4_9BACT
MLVFLLLPGTLTSAQSLLKPGKNKYEKGKLVNERPVGLWEYYDEAGNKELAVQYDSSRIVFQRPDTARYELRSGDTWKLGRPSRAPRLLGSHAKEMRLITGNIRYPGAALREQVQGDVLISYVVTKEGRATNFTVEKSLSEACDQAVWNGLKERLSTWVPAVYQGRPTDARFYLRATFRIIDSEQDLQESNKRLQESEARQPYTDHVIITAIFKPINVQLPPQGL